MYQIQKKSKFRCLQAIFAKTLGHFAQTRSNPTFSSPAGSYDRFQNNNGGAMPRFSVEVSEFDSSVGSFEFLKDVSVMVEYTFDSSGKF